MGEIQNDVENSKLGNGFLWFAGLPCSSLLLCINNSVQGAGSGIPWRKDATVGPPQEKLQYDESVSSPHKTLVSR